ncbi:SpoVR family protein [Haloarcula sp. KBTZ06]|uniref:SpoVR family protein n=1 Tax=unclassified Haloarcula TaxID=2624677 RepID=UPI0005955884|nr:MULTISPECIES: SpoVR family protein [unclassified Haloarcula]AJF27183.1 SpoVR family protein [Haloarcula sp. CBA1115]KAA9407005.1 SpoVR family protein [Haloarcula sp. CBA1131]KZX48734.1 SpoVR family protein [Haloarcula sp. K1]MUV48654.1 SpoVR family protein [Haloarcula sp. CBA1122]
MNDDRFAKQRVADDLDEPVEEAGNLARKLGLKPYPVNYWIVDYDEMNELIAYGGFQQRYPHWRWGMQYDRQQKQGQFLGGKAFEIVNNDDPAHAFLQESNTLADQKAVITHVEAHADFFANNEWFRMFTDGSSRTTTDASGEDRRRGPDAAGMLARHGDTIQEYMQDPDIERAEVERFIDHVLCLEDNIDQHIPYSPVETVPEEFEDIEGADVTEQLDDLELSEEVKRQVFDEEWLDAQRDDDENVTFPAEPEKDVLGFLRKHGMQYDGDAERATEMEDWQTELLELLRREAYYFAPQKMTKVMNEGWACVDPETPVFTADGLVPMEDVVSDHVTVSDGEQAREVYDSNIIPDHDTVTIETRRGFELTGSNNHRVRQPDGDWVRLDELETGDEIAVTGGNGTWPETNVPIEWTCSEYTSLNDVADEAGVSVWTVMRYRRTGSAEKAEAIDRALDGYEEGGNAGLSNRESIRIPETVDELFGRFLGLLIGDGHVPSNSRHIGFTSGKQAHAEEFAGLLSELFGIEATVERQESRWRVYAYSKNLRDLLTEEFDLPTGVAAAEKTVPDQILRSPKQVVAEFIRGLFDADGYAGEQGAILSTKSEDLSKRVQLLLTNFGVLSRRREQSDGCYHVHLTGASANTFADEIGFGYEAKATELSTYLDELAWFETESWTDEIVDVETGTGDVYDISVEETHRYAAAGFVNHNSYWESTMMTGEQFAGDDEFILYSDHMSKVLGSGGLNPYSLGLEIWEYVENTENRREVIERLLRVEGITWRNFDESVDYKMVQDHLEPPAWLTAVPNHLDDLDPEDPRVDSDGLAAARDGEFDVEQYPWKVLTYEGLAQRHYSLVKPQYRGFVSRVGQEELERTARYMFDNSRYDSVEDALDDVDYTRGWERMREIRESHNDVTFLDEFLTQEFVDDNDYFTYEYTHASGDYRVTSTDHEDVKKKLMLQFTNFGKPTVVVEDGNYQNRNELLLAHQYNGVMLDIGQAKEVLKRTFELWGRPVNLLTIVKEFDDHDVEVAKRRDREPEPEEVGKRIRYDGDEVTVTDVDWSEVEHLTATDIDYNTKPDEWLA